MTALRSEAQPTKDSFGHGLAEALAVRGMRQSDLAEALDTTQSSVSAWITGKSEPHSRTVWQIEEILGVTPGQLSRFLGYLPTSAMGVTPSVEECIASSPRFVDDSKRMLIQIVRTVAAKDRLLLHLNDQSA